MANGIRSPLDALDKWFEPTSSKVRMVRNRGGSRLPLSRSSAGSSSAVGRGIETAKLLAKKTPQVMVKISGAGRGMDKTKNHLDYISRNGQLELIDQDGRRFENREAVNDLKDEWRASGVPEQSDKRECFNIVFGMPAGTSPEALRRAVADFAEERFRGHKYVMALHEPNTDSKTTNPHVHLCVVAVNEQGRRLNPRKDDLRRWREGFAVKLREQGVDALATSRRQHLQRQGPEGFKARKKRERQAERPAPASSRQQRGSPDYERVNQRSVRVIQHAAAVYQSRAAKLETRATAIPVAGVRNLPAGHVVSDQGAQKQRAAQMFLQQNAPGHLGRKGVADSGVRRSRTGASGHDGAGERVSLAERKAQFDVQLREGARILVAAAQEIRKSDPKLASDLRRYAGRVGADTER